MIKIEIVNLLLFDGECIPFLILKRKNRDVLPNLHYTVEEKKDTIYLLESRYNLFDSLAKETIDYFEKEFAKYSKNGCFDKNSFKEGYKKDRYTYLRNVDVNSSNKRTLKIYKKIISEIKKTKYIGDPVLKYTNKEKLREEYYKKMINTETKDNYLEVKDLGYIIPVRQINIPFRKWETKDEIYLLQTFLYAIYNTDYNFKIVKCKNCNKFFFTQKRDTLYCDRIYKDGKTCKSYIKCEDLKRRNGLVPELSKRIYEKEKKRKKSSDFLKKEKEMLEKYPNNKEKQINFYLSFYTDTVGGIKSKLKTIKDFNLYPYIKEKEDN